MYRLGYVVFSGNTPAERFRVALASEPRIAGERVRVHRDRLDPQLEASLERPHPPEVANRRFVRAFGVGFAIGAVGGALVDLLLVDTGGTVWGVLLGGAVGTLIGGGFLVVGSRRQRVVHRLRDMVEHGAVLVTLRADERALSRVGDLASEHGAELHTIG